MPATVCGLKNCDWLVLVRHLRWVHSPTPPINTHHNCFIQIQFSVAPGFKLLNGVHQNLRSRVVLSYYCNVIHEGNVIKLFGLFDAMTNAQCFSRAREMLQQGINEDNKDTGRRSPPLVLHR
jgi:hypothetical protein